MTTGVTQNGSSHALQERLNDPSTVDTLVRLLDRVDTIDLLLSQGPGMAALVTDSVDEFVAASGTDLELVLHHALQMAHKLQNPRLVTTLTRLLDQTDALELVVGLAEQGPGMLGVVADSLDELVASAAKSGVDVEVLLQNGLKVASKLQNPHTVDALAKLLEQTEALELLAGAAEQGPGLLALLGDAVDEAARQALDAGLDVELLLQNSLKIATHLQNPRLMNAIANLLNQTEAIEMLANLAEQGPGLLSIVADSADEFVATAQFDVELLTDKGLGALVKIIEFVQSSQFETLLDSGMLDPQAVAVLGKVGKALANSSHQEIKPMGAWGLLKLLGDPDVQQGLGFLANFGRHIGQELTTLKQST